MPMLACAGVSDDWFFAVLSMDCRGQIHFLNSYPLGLSFGFRGDALADHMWSKLKVRIQPGLGLIRRAFRAHAIAVINHEVSIREEASVRQPFGSRSYQQGSSWPAAL